MKIYYLLLSICYLLLSCNSIKYPGVKEKLKSVIDIDISKMPKREIKLISLLVPIDTSLNKLEIANKVMYCKVIYGGPISFVDSKIDSIIITIDSSITQSKLIGQVYFRDSSDYGSNVHPLENANLKMVNITKNKTFSILSDFNGHYSTQLSNGMYEIIVSSTGCNAIHLYGLRVRSFEIIKLNITLGSGKSSTYINANKLTPVKH